MALLESEDAYRSWNGLLASVKDMIDLVHFAGAPDTVNSMIAPKVSQVIDKFSQLPADQENVVHLGAEFEQFLAEHHGWNGRGFEHSVAAVELLSSLKCFRVESGQTLGKGAYARVLLARNHLTGDTAVHKHVKLDSPEHGMPLHVIRELSLLQKMRHAHVVRYGSASVLRCFAFDFRSTFVHGTCRGNHDVPVVNKSVFHAWQVKCQLLRAL